MIFYIFDENQDFFHKTNLRESSGGVVGEPAHVVPGVVVVVAVAPEQNQFIERHFT